MTDRFDSREFYELCQAYRHSDQIGSRPADTAAAFEAIKAFARAGSVEAEPVAWRYRHWNAVYQRFNEWGHSNIKPTWPVSECEPLYRHPAPAAPPVPPASEQMVLVPRNEIEALVKLLDAAGFTNTVRELNALLAASEKAK